MADIQAHLADGRTLHFPDGTSTDVIQSTVKKMVGSQTPAQSAPMGNQTPGLSEAQLNKEAEPWRKISTLKGWGEQISEVPGAVAQGLKNIPQGLKPLSGWSFDPTKNLTDLLAMGLPAVMEGQKAKEQFQQPGVTNKTAAVARGTGALLGDVGGTWTISKGEQAGQGDILPAAAEVGTSLSAPKAIGPALKVPGAVMDFARRATSLNEVTKAGAGLYQGKIQPTIQTLQEAIKSEGSRTIQQAIDADNKSQTIQGKGVISAAPAIAEAAKAMEDTGHAPTPQTRTLLNRLNSQSFMTLEEAKNLRTDIGTAASKAERAGNAKLGKIMWTAYTELGEGMAQRVEELSGSRKPFEHYNNEFKAAFELNKGVTGNMMESIADRHDAMPKLKEFAGADLTEIKDQMTKYGQDPGALDQAQKHAKSLMDAHEAISGKYNKGLYRLVMAGGGSSAALLGLSVYSVMHGAGLYGLTPLLLSSYIASKTMGLTPTVEAGRILRKLSVNPDAFQVRTPVEGPQSFNYPNPDDAWTSPKPPSGPSVGSASGAASDTAAFQQAKGELGPNASISDVAQRAQQIKSIRAGGESDLEAARRGAAGEAEGKAENLVPKEHRASTKIVKAEQERSAGRIEGRTESKKALEIQKIKKAKR